MPGAGTLSAYRQRRKKPGARSHRGAPWFARHHPAAGVRAATLLAAADDCIPACRLCCKRRVFAGHRAHRHCRRRHAVLLLFRCVARAPAACVITALALPVLPSLQFTLGYPMRIISAALAVPLLRAHGLDVARQGTFLLWRDEMIQFDAPCSGVNMLWAGLLLTPVGCVLLRLHPLK